MSFIGRKPGFGLQILNQTATLTVLETTLERMGVVLIPENGGGAGVRLATASEPVEMMTGKHKAAGHETGNG